MPENFLASKGCVFSVKATAGSGDTQGFYRLEPPIQGTPESPVFIQGVELGLSDLTSNVPTMDDLKIIYTSGTEFGDVRIIGQILLGPNNSSATGMNAVINWFNERRMTKSKSSVDLSVPGNSAAYRVYIKGLGIGTIDEQFHVQSFMLTGVLAELPT